MQIDSFSPEWDSGAVQGRRSVEERAARHAALGDPARLAIVDELARSDRAPVELRRLVGLESNLLAHHLDVLEGVGMISRSRSSGDGRRRYAHLLPDSPGDLVPRPPVQLGPAPLGCSADPWPGSCWDAPGWTARRACC